MCLSWFRSCWAVAAGILCGTVTCGHNACGVSLHEADNCGTGCTAERATKPRCVAASVAEQSNSLEGARGETCSEFEQVSLMQVGYHLNPHNQADENAAGKEPIVPVGDSAQAQSSFISRSAAVVKLGAIPLQLTQLHVFITSEHTSATRSIGGVLWWLFGVCSFIVICMIGATCFVGFMESDTDLREGFIRRTPKGSKSQSPPPSKSRTPQQRRQDHEQQQQEHQQQQQQPQLLPRSMSREQSQQKQRFQSPEEGLPASLLLQSAQQLNECQASLRQSQQALQHARTPAHSSTTPIGAPASRSDSVFTRMLGREDTRMLSLEGSSGATGGEGAPIPDLSTPPILCQSLVLSNAEARFMLPMDSLLHADVGVPIDITGSSRRKLLQACILQGGGGSLELHVSSIGFEDDPRAVVVSDPSRSPMLKIFARGGHLFGTLGMSEGQGQGRAVLTCGGARAMTIEPGNMDDLEMTAYAMDGRVLANAGRISPPLPLRAAAATSSCVGDDSWKLQVKPHNDAVLIVACMLSMMLLQQRRYPTPSRESLDVDTAPSLRGVGRHEI